MNPDLLFFLVDASHIFLHDNKLADNLGEDGKCRRAAY